MQKNYTIRQAAVFSLCGRVGPLDFHSFLSPLSPYFASKDILSSLQPLKAHNTASISTELEGHSIHTCVRNYFALSVVCTKIAVSAIVKIHDVHIKVAVSL